MLTVRQIAEFAGVSKSTVSLVLNEKSGVSDEMRQAVLKAVGELQVIQPAASTHSWKRPASGDNRPRGVSLMVLHPPILRSSFVFSEVLAGIQSAAESFSAQLRLVMNEPDASPQHIGHLYLSDDTLRPDGVLVFGARQREPLADRALERQIPCVVLGRDITRYATSGIGRDEVRCAADLTRHLLELGHERIAFAGGNPDYDYTHTRIEGYQSALREAGITPQESWVCLGSGSDATERLLHLEPAVTALIFVNDSYLAEGLPVLQAHGLNVPHDLSVASFDDTDVARQSDITSIWYDRVSEGQWAVRMLMDLIRHPSLARSSLMFRAQLIARTSTAPRAERIAAL